MDCTFTYQATEEGTTAALKSASDAKDSDWYVLAATVALAMAISVAYFKRGLHAGSDYVHLGLIISFPLVWWFVRFFFIWAVIRFLRKHRAFDCPTEVHLTDEFMEISRAGHSTRWNWNGGGLTHYLLAGNRIFFFVNNAFCGELHFPTDKVRLDELLPVLEKNGIRPHRKGIVEKCFLLAGVAFFLVLAVVILLR